MGRSRKRKRCNETNYFFFYRNEMKTWKTHYSIREIKKCKERARERKRERKKRRRGGISAIREGH